VWFVRASAILHGTPKKGETEELCLDIVTHIPREEVACLRIKSPILRPSELCVKMHSLVHLHLSSVDLSKWFVEPDAHEPRELLPRLGYVTVPGSYFGSDWSPLTDFLSRRAAVAGWVPLLRLPVEDFGIRTSSGVTTFRIAQGSF